MGKGIGVCYGTLGDNLPPPTEVVEMFKEKNIRRMRIYNPDVIILKALKGSGIELVLGVPNEILRRLAEDPSFAAKWVHDNIVKWPDVKIKYLAVGNEISPFRTSESYTTVLVPAMRNIYKAIVDVHLDGQVKVSTAIDTGLLGVSFPPSAGAFKAEVMWMIRPLVRFLVETHAPLLVNLYPYFSYIKDKKNININYAAFKDPRPRVHDSGNNLQYHNLFDAMVDAAYAALEKVGGSSLKIVISETGWPSAGGDSATKDSARSYNQNLIKHVKKGTPKKPNVAIETYVFAMFNENEKEGKETEKNFGLFYPISKAPVYRIDFS